MQVRLSEWGMALSAAIAVHAFAFAIWYWVPVTPTDAGAGGISIALAPAVSVSDDQTQTEVLETQEPPLIEEEPVVTPLTDPSSQPVPEPIVDTRVQPVERVPAPRETQPTASSAPAAVSVTSNQVSTGSAAAEVGLGDANAKADYVALIADRLARFKRYPRAARRRGLQGVAKLAFTVRRDGSLVTYEIVQSAGYQVLDREVQSTLERALPMPPFPSELSQQTLEVIVPIRFELTNN